MRIPFLAGWLDRTRERTRLLVARGRTPNPIPGPWTLTAVVRDAEAAEPDSPEGGAGLSPPSSRPPPPPPPPGTPV